MASQGPVCPGCARPVAVGQHFCPNCGTSLDPTQRVPGTPSSRDDAWDTVIEANKREWNSYVSVARRRTGTGMSLMLAGFALIWIPYLSFLGDLFAFIGVIFLWLGRHAFDDSYHRGVVLGSVLVVLGLLVGVVVGFAFASEVANAATTPGESISAFGASLNSDLLTLVIGSFIAAIIVGLGWVTIPYGRADNFTRTLLWVAFATSMAISAVGVWVLWSQASSAIASVTSGSSVNLGPLQALQFESLELGLLQFVPYMIFFWAYYRTKSQMAPEHASGNTMTPASSEFGRVD
jgi:hypothetical protein